MRIIGRCSTTVIGCNRNIVGGCVGSKQNVCEYTIPGSTDDLSDKFAIFLYLVHKSVTPFLTGKWRKSVVLFVLFICSYKDFNMNFCSFRINLGPFVLVS